MSVLYSTGKAKVIDIKLHDHVNKVHYHVFNNNI